MGGGEEEPALNFAGAGTGHWRFPEAPPPHSLYAEYQPSQCLVGVGY